MIDALSAYARRPENRFGTYDTLLSALRRKQTIGRWTLLGGFNAEVKYIFDLFANSDSEFLRDFAEAAAELLRQISGGIFDDGGLASSGLIRFFQRIIEFFRTCSRYSASSERKALIKGRERNLPCFFSAFLPDPFLLTVLSLWSIIFIAIH